MRFNHSSVNSWWNAFLHILLGPAPQVGNGFKWKQSVLSLAIVGTISSPFFTFYLSRPYQGEIPSNEQLIKSGGVLTFGFERQGIKTVPFALFKASNGHTFRLQDPSGLNEIKNFEKRYGTNNLYVEGFLLQDGAGLFWPTYIARANGETILSKEVQYKKLEIARNPFGKVLLYMYAFVALLWIASIINISKFKNSLGA